MFLGTASNENYLTVTTWMGSGNMTESSRAPAPCFSSEPVMRKGKLRDFQLRTCSVPHEIKNIFLSNKNCQQFHKTSCFYVSAHALWMLKRFGLELRGRRVGAVVYPGRSVRSCGHVAGGCACPSNESVPLTSATK